MKEFKINANEAGQRFDKYLKKLLKEANTSFIYKMLRKKNIVLNGKKADGTEKLNVPRCSFDWHFSNSDAEHLFMCFLAIWTPS